MDTVSRVFFPKKKEFFYLFFPGGDVVVKVGSYSTINFVSWIIISIAQLLTALRTLLYMYYPVSSTAYYTTRLEKQMVLLFDL